MQFPSHQLEHSTLTGLKASLQALPMGADGQVLSTIDLMKAYAIEDSKHPLILETAKRIAYGNRPLDQAVHQEANTKLRFVEDTANAAQTNIASLAPDADVIEVLTRPADVEILSQRSVVSGDCDDFAMYVASLLLALETLGFPVSNVRFVTIAADTENPSEFSHVYVRCDYMGSDTAIDASHGPYAGWHAEDRAFRKTEHLVKAMSYSASLALALILGFVFLVKKAPSFRNTSMGRLLA